AGVVAVAGGGGVTERAPGRYAAAREDAAQVDGLVAEVRRQHGPVGGVLHLAPVGGPGVAVASLTADQWSARLGHDVKGLFHLLRAVGADLAARPRGFVAAVTGQDGAFGRRR